MSFLLPTSLWSILLISASAYEQSDLIFLKDYVTQQESFTNDYHVIICSKMDGLGVVKMLSETLHRFVSIGTTEEKLLQKRNEPSTFLLHLRCPKWMEILQQAEQSDLYRKPYRWILLGRKHDEEEIVTVRGGENITGSDLWTFLESLPILIDSDLKLALKDRDGKVSVTSPYKIAKGKELIKESLSEWTLRQGLKIFNREIIAIRRWNLRGLVMPTTLVITDQDSMNHLSDLVDKHKDTSSKVSYNFVKLYELMFNMSLSFRMDGSWGEPLRNGSWTGMVGDIQRGEIQVGASPVFMRQERLNILEYYASVNPTKVSFIFISPPLSHSRNIFVLPFATVVWICCLVTFLVSCCALFVAINSESRQNDFEKHNEHLNISLSEIAIYNIGAICLQGTAAHTQQPAGRIITIFVYLAYMFLYISYSASIVAILQSSDTSIQTLSDLLRSPMKAGADDVAYSQYYFKSTKDPFRKRFYDVKISPEKEAPHFLPPEAGIKKVRQGLFAFHVEATVGYEIIQKTFTEDEKCGLQELKVSFFQVGDPWLVMKKHNPYSEMFKIGSKRIIETGFKSRIARRLYTKKPPCGSKGSRFLSVGIIDCYHAFMLLAYGTAVALTVFVAEIILKNFCHSRRPFESVLDPRGFRPKNR